MTDVDSSYSYPLIPTEAIPRRAIEDAVRAWLVAGAGLTEDRVWFADHGVVETTFPFATVAWLSTTPLGRDGEGSETLIEDEDLEDDGASDVRLWVGGWRQVVFSVQVFGQPKEGPETSAVMRLEAAVAKLNLPSRRAALYAAGLGVLSVSAIRNVAPGQVAVELTGIVASNVSEDVRSIQGVRVVTSDESEVEAEIIAPEGFTPP